MNIDTRPDLAASARTVLGSDGDFLTTRVSYKLNLRGPSVNVQTACSTSLVAVHMACRSLRAYECDMALAGGVAYTGQAIVGHVYHDGGIMSRDGHCRPFDASASGTVSGNGVAIVALRRLSDALADGDIVHAVIRGSAINNDGSEKVGFTAPGVEGQSQVIAMALADAGVDPTTVAYVEAHGTGTALGDPIEVAALTRAYGPSSGTGPARWIGSVKSNVGHLDAAAGIAGLCKAVLCLKHGELVPTLNYKDQNQKIDFQKGGFSVVSERLSWEAPAGHPRRAAVSSFGMGGTNAHVVLEEAPARKPGAVVDGLQVLTLSARTDDRLEAASAELAGFLSLRPELPVSNVAHTLQTARTSFRHRKVVLARTGAEAVSALTGRGIVHVWKSTVRSDGGKVAFMFPGQGAQYEGMGRQLYDRDSEFRSTVDECAEKLGDVLGRDLREIIYSSGREGDRNEVLTARPLATQLALFVVELGLARQWMEWGIQPSACIGHSVGEYVAACVSGALELDDALGLLKVRGQLMKDAPDGAMVAVPLSEASLAGRLGEGVWLSAVNGPDACVVSGVPECVAELTTVLQSEGIECRRLHTGGAFHSGLMEGVVSPLVAAAGAVNVGRIGIPYVSNVTGEWVSSADLDATYWGRHVRQTVRFNDGLSCVLKDGVTVLLEVGPGNTLATLARRRLRGKERKEVTVLTSLRHARQDATEEETIGEAIGRLWGAGLEPRWLAYAGSQRQRVQLPTYPFARDRYWIEPGFANASPHRGAVQGRGELEAWFHVPVWKQVVPYAGKSPGERANPGPWLVFVGVHGVGDALAEALEARGHETIRVMPGSGYDKVGRHAYSLDPGSADAFRRLFEELASEGIVPRRIVHAWSMATGPEDGRAFDRGFYSLLYLLQAARAPEDDTLGATVLTNQTFSVAGEPVWHAERAGLLGLCMVAPQNVLGLRCYAVDLDAGAESVDLQALLRLIETPTAQVSALRNGRQFVRSLEPMPLPPVIEGHGALRFGGSYLITGGLGNVGRALARFLAEKVGAKLTLVSRSGLPSGIGEEHPRVSVVRELEAAGAEVLVAQADVTDGGQLTQAIAAAERRFGQIHGIVHAAGLTVGDTFKTLDALKREAFEEQFAAKWHGVRAIREALGDRVLDFCLVTSSLSVELGGLKMGAYAAANTIMDHLCEQFDRESATPWIAVDWDAWCFDDDLADDALAFVAEEGVETFERILAASTPSKVVVCTGDYATRLARSIPEGHVTAEGDIRHARPDLDSAYIAPRDQVEDAIGAVWADALGLAQVGAHDDFFELGGDSLMAVQLMPKLNSHFGVEIGLQALFESPTVSELAKRVHVLKRSLNATRQDEPDNGDRDELLL
jgi:acyl transferase domain-containing protein